MENPSLTAEQKVELSCLQRHPFILCSEKPEDCEAHKVLDSLVGLGLAVVMRDIDHIKGYPLDRYFLTPRGRDFQIWPVCLVV